MHAIEKQVLLHLFTKEIAVALLDEKEQARKVSSFFSVVLCMCMVNECVYHVICMQ